MKHTGIKENKPKKERNPTDYPYAHTEFAIHYIEIQICDYHSKCAGRCTNRNYVKKFHLVTPSEFINPSV
ncbi:hypothetical protein SDC9_182914 [bioreactor metagenome]|uniref:Uncharacterized protein n=1 Tax=bioreactor metagenome TaxID=1076179 RepID=A0A645HA65_9ZZZZ